MHLRGTANDPGLELGLRVLPRHGGRWTPWASVSLRAWWRREAPATPIVEANVQVGLAYVRRVVRRVRD